MSVLIELLKYSYAWFSSVFRFGIIVSVVVTVGGCANSSSELVQPFVNVEALAQLPPDANTVVRDELDSVSSLVDLQRALIARNLYQTQTGDYNFLVDTCPVKVEAHRGHYRSPENSLNGLTAAAFGGFDGAEIDVMVTRDGYWVGHHDKYTGRATGERKGQRFNIESITRKEWARVLLRDKNGLLTSQAAPSALHLFKHWGTVSLTDQKLNIEIKGDASREELRKLSAQARSGIVYRNRYYFSSMDMKTLKRMREIDPDIYLAYIWDPHPRSVAKFKKSLRRAVGSDKTYKNNLSNINWLSRYEERRRRRKGDLHKLSPKKIVQELGRNAGLHIDVRNFTANPSLKVEAERAGIKRIATYTINGSDFHVSSLAKLRAKNTHLPDLVIADVGKVELCSLVKPGITAKQGAYNPHTAVGKLVASLPNDADLINLKRQRAYVPNGYYLTQAGKILPLTSSSTTPRADLRPSKHSEPTVAEDEGLDLTLEAIELVLPSAKEI